MIGRTKKRKAYNTQLQDSVAARVNSDCADWEKSNANEFTHGTHDRNLNPATPAGQDERITSTDEYDAAGRPTIVTDAAGKTFETTYNADGQVLTVYRTDVNPDKKIVEYGYGTSGVSNGMPISVTDGIYLHWQAFTYESDGGGRGQIQKVESGDEFSLSPNCTVTYVYNDAGERWRVKYETPNTGSSGQWWQYSDYIRVGNPDAPKRVFQTLNRMSNSTTLSEEEFHYIFDSSGRLMHAAFAQTPTLSSPNNGEWYIETSPASSRAVASYDYAPGGQVLEVVNRWHVWDDQWEVYDVENVQKSVYQYNATTGLRTQVEYYLESSGWTLDHKQEYGYDSNLDYLTSAAYSTSYTGSESWSYDAAGNRIGTGYSYDNLNRMESSPGYVYQNDVLGNRTWRNYGQSGVQRYIWDEVNRLKSLCGTSEGARYEYRADGMRVMKIADLTISWNPDDTELGSGFYDEILSVNKPTTRYFYDGQMPMEEDFKITGGFGSPTVTVTQYGLGARGIDYIRNKVGNDPETIVFPIYDGHGNMVHTLSRGANDTFSLGNKRIYGAWGDLRHDGNPGDGPNTQYCANLGHKKDNESGLTYMRARYYEPWTGRFISEDPARAGLNWFIYCSNDPVSKVDYTGEEEQGDAFDPVYQFKWGKWWFMYRSTWVSILLLPIAFRKGLAWGGLAIAGIVGRTLLLGSSIVELWGLRISAWYIWLFDGELLPDGMIAKPTFGNLPIPGVGFYDEPPDYAGGVGRSW